MLFQWSDLQTNVKGPANATTPKSLMIQRGSLGLRGHTRGLEGEREHAPRHYRDDVRAVVHETHYSREVELSDSYAQPVRTCPPTREKTGRGPFTTQGLGHAHNPRNLQRRLTVYRQ